MYALYICIINQHLWFIHIITKSSLITKTIQKWTLIYYARLDTIWCISVIWVNLENNGLQLQFLQKFDKDHQKKKLCRNVDLQKSLHMCWTVYACRTLAWITGLMLRSMEAISLWVCWDVQESKVILKVAFSSSSWWKWTAAEPDSAWATYAPFPLLPVQNKIRWRVSFTCVRFYPFFQTNSALVPSLPNRPKTPPYGLSLLHSSGSSWLVWSFIFVLW